MKIFLITGNKLSLFSVRIFFKFIIKKRDINTAYLLQIRSLSHCILSPSDSLLLTGCTSSFIEFTLATEDGGVLLICFMLAVGDGGFVVLIGFVVTLLTKFGG